MPPAKPSAQSASPNAQDKILQWLYCSRAGQLILPFVIKPTITRIGGALLNSRLSRLAIPGFIRSNNIDMSQFENRKFVSYNDFFTRKIKPEARPLCPDLNALVSPCDSLLSAYPLSDDARFRIKGTEYTLRQLIRDESIAKTYCGGTLLLFRLTVSDYHRYCYAASGYKSADTLIPGVFHTVNPLAAAVCPLYKENTRVCSVLISEEFGEILMMEVGALMVGKIANDKKDAGFVERGQEKGRFEFGGSTIILCLRKNTAAIDPLFFENTENEVETPVRYGQKIASSL